MTWDPMETVVCRKMLVARAIARETKHLKYQKQLLAKLKEAQKFANLHGLDYDVRDPNNSIFVTSCTEELRQLIKGLKVEMSDSKNGIIELKYRPGVTVLPHFKYLRAVRQLREENAHKFKQRVQELRELLRDQFPDAASLISTFAERAWRGNLPEPVQLIDAIKRKAKRKRKKKA